MPRPLGDIEFENKLIIQNSMSYIIIKYPEADPQLLTI